MVVACVLLLALAAVLIDVGMLSYQHKQMQSGCEAAALAGAGELMNPAVLYPSATVRDPVVWTRLQVKQARRTTLDFANRNISSGEPLPLQADSDIQFLWAPEPISLDSDFIPFSEASQQCNSIEVTCIRSRERRNAIGLGIGSMLGLPYADIQAQGRASLSQRVYGVRPTELINAPVVPLLAEATGSPYGWFEQSARSVEDRHNDHYSIDPETNTVARGCDQIPEIELRFAHPLQESSQKADERGNLWRPVLGGTRAKEDLFTRQVVSGLHPSDLRPWGGELVAATHRATIFNCTQKPDQADQKVIKHALNSIRGQKRIWLLSRNLQKPRNTRPDKRGNGDISTGHRPRNQHVIVAFAAGQVVDTRIEKTGDLVILVQPCLMTSVTTLTDGKAPRNPWLGKLTLTK